MHVIDLTHPIRPDMPVYPGTAAPRFEPLTTVALHGFAERLLTLASHTGTHVDAPAHLLPGGLTLDRFPAERFVGPACVVDASTAGDGKIGMELLRPRADDVAACDFLLLRTHWSRHWGRPAYFEGFPTLTPEAAAWLADRQLKGVGVDAISVDPVEAASLPVHHTLLGAGLILIENLANLGELPPSGFTLCCLPLALTEADGAPCRAVALLPC